MTSLRKCPCYNRHRGSGKCILEKEEWKVDISSAKEILGSDKGGGAVCFGVTAKGQGIANTKERNGCNITKKPKDAE